MNHLIEHRGELDVAGGDSFSEELFFKKVKKMAGSRVENLVKGSKYCLIPKKRSMRENINGERDGGENKGQRPGVSAQMCR